jgi:AmmeMemoRadiSam system protein B
MDFPRIRPVTALPVQQSGKTWICLQDPQNISPKALFLPPPVYFIISHFDGQHSIVDIQAEYMRKFGDFLFTEKLEEIISQLEENLFLEGERFQETLRQKQEAFKQAPFREAVFAGKSYEQDAERLKDQMDGYFRGPDGPGPLGERSPGEKLKAVIAPHIDFQRGGFCYAFTHQEIWKRSSARCFVIFGTAHTAMKHPFCLTRKDFMTPLGSLEAHQELIDSIQSKCPYDLYADEGVHRNEHSIEFQCLFLRFMFPAPTPLKIIPILSGYFHEAFEKGISPMEIKPVRQFVDALRESVSSLQEEVCYIASADLAHMGLQFGDQGGVGEVDLRILEGEDQEMLAYVERMDGEGFSNSILKDRDRRRICGYPAIYGMLNCLDAKTGKLLKYGQAFTPETQSVVTFASMAFH